MRGEARNNGNSGLNGHPDDSDQFNPYALAHLPGTLKNSSLGKLHIAHHFSLLLHQDAPYTRYAQIGVVPHGYAGDHYIFLWLLPCGNRDRPSRSRPPCDYCTRIEWWCDRYDTSRRAWW